METTKEKVSYCIGLETGRNIKKQFNEIDVSSLSQGFEDAISEATPLLNNGEVQNILTMLKQQIEMQQRQFFTKLAEDNKIASETFLTENRSKPGIIATSSGLQYRVIQSGNGPMPGSLDVVSVHYKGSFIDGRVFDSTYEKGAPHTFALNRMIPGWTEALKKMKVGDKWEIFIPSYLAYGENGLGNDIGPNMALVFELELIEIK